MQERWLEERTPGGAERAAVIRMLGWAALVGFSLQCLKTIGFPSLWAATHLYFDYHFGFMKRAFLGAVLRRLGFDMGKYANGMIVGYAAMIGAFAALLWIGRRARLNRTVSGAFLAAVFWSSWAVAYSVHSVGYFDHVLLLVALGSIALCLRLPQLPAAALASVLGIIGVLIHENYVVGYAPLVFVCLLLQRRYVGCVLFTAVTIGAVLIVLQLGLPSGVTKPEMEQHYRSIMEYGIRPDAFDVLFRDAAANLAEMRKRWTYRPHWLSLVLSLIVFLSAGSLLALAAQTVAKRCAVDTLQRRLIASAVPAAAFSPLLLHLLGWDMHRWNGMVVVNAFVLLCPAQACSGEAIECGSAARTGWHRWGIFAVLLGSATGFGLFNRMDVVNAPYLSHVNYVLDVLGGKAEFPRIPRR